MSRIVHSGVEEDRMNMKEFILSLGPDKLIQHYKDHGFKSLGEYIESVTGESCSSYGVTDGGVLLSQEMWGLLEMVVVDPVGFTPKNL